MNVGSKDILLHGVILDMRLRGDSFCTAGLRRLVVTGGVGRR